MKTEWCNGQHFEVTASIHYPARTYTNITLKCVFSVYTDHPIDTPDKVAISWFTMKSSGKTSIWKADSMTGLNQGLGGNQDRLIGSSVDLSSLNRDGHSITFTQLKKRDAGQYWCKVRYKTQNSEWISKASNTVTLRTYGSKHEILYIFKMVYCLVKIMGILLL